MPVILHVDPSTADRDAIREALASQETWTIEGAASCEEARERLQLHPIDLILSESELGDGEWRDLLSTVRSRHLTTPVLIISSSMTVESAAQAARDGAEAVLVKGSDPSDWLYPIECAMERSASQSMRQAAEGSLTQQTLKFTLKNEKGRVPYLVSLLIEYCDQFGLIDDRDRMRVQVALEEALLNAIIHGNLEVSSRLRELDGDLFEQAIIERKQLEPFRSRSVTLVADYTHSEARFIIRDEGPGFDVETVRNPTEDDTIALASGRGILLMRSFMDAIDFNDKGNEVTMVKRRSESLEPLQERAAVACGVSGT